jgi:hypothetical protein
MNTSLPFGTDRPAGPFRRGELGEGEGGGFYVIY